MTYIKLMVLISVAYFLNGCSSSYRIAKTSTGIGEGIELGELPLHIDVKKAKIKGATLMLSVQVKIDGAQPYVETKIYKVIDGKEILLGKTDNQGVFNTATPFSTPDTFSFVSFTYQKRYLYVK